MTTRICTYTTGLNFKTERIITKNDIINLCNLLNNKDEYSSLCEFKPEGITEGGILYKFKNEHDKKFYKSVRLGICNNIGKWCWINENVMTEWLDNDDIIFNKNVKFTTFLKSFNGAPLFTIEELKLWEQCFNQIGIVKVGKYPTKKSLKTENEITN